MNKLTIKPGNGLNSPNKGEYVKINLKISDKKGKSIFDSTVTDGVTIRYLEGNFIINSTILNLKIKDNHFISELEDLIGKMTLFERCTIELTLDMAKQSEFLTDSFRNNNILIFDVEIVHISNFPYKV